MLFYAAKQGHDLVELAVNFLLAHAKDRSIHVNIFGVPSVQDEIRYRPRARKIRVRLSLLSPEVGSVIRLNISAGCSYQHIPAKIIPEHLSFAEPQNLRLSTPRKCFLHRARKRVRFFRFSQVAEWSLGRPEGLSPQSYRIFFLLPLSGSFAQLFHSYDRPAHCTLLGQHPQTSFPTWKNYKGHTPRATGRPGHSWRSQTTAWD